MSDNLKAAQQHLLHLIREHDGFLPFEKYMEQALYHVDYGYYANSIANVGAAGDFSTSATVSPLLGRAIVSWVRERHRELALGRKWHLIEVGGGNGLLAKRVLHELGWLQRLGCQYHIVEVSPRLRQLQEDALERYSIQWHSHLGEAIQSAGGKALIISNELIDAFPVQCFLYEEGQWREVGLIEEKGIISEASRMRLSDRADYTYQSLSEIWPDGKEGLRYEVAYEVAEWLKEWSTALHCGSVLTIDYGDEQEPLLRQFPFGSLRAYYQHIPLEGDELYRRFGRQDITCEVNFTLLQRWAEEAGLRTVGTQNQKEFILQRLGNKAIVNVGDEMMISSAGAGAAFKVTEWVKP
ncbi:MAG: SAM-dependent methyltransferase [Verrucomicrobiota bacterium]